MQYPAMSTMYVSDYLHMSQYAVIQEGFDRWSCVSELQTGYHDNWYKVTYADMLTLHQLVNT